MSEQEDPKAVGDAEVEEDLDVNHNDPVDLKNWRTRLHPWVDAKNREAITEKEAGRKGHSNGF